MSIKNELVNRRGFLRGSAAAGASVAAGGLLPEPAKADGIPPRWDKEVDVVIVGTGHSGLAAAITAADAGAKVVILEKMKKEFEGGNSKVSGNMWWTPTDLPQAMQYIEALSYGLTGKECVQALAEEMLKLNAWLETLGIKHSPLGIFQPEHPELPGAACVRTWSNGGSSDGRLWTPLRELVEKRNVEVMYEAPVKALIQTPSREIAGIRAEVAGKPYYIKAKKGVILCCGGFEFDFEMQKQFLPGLADLRPGLARQHRRRHSHGATGRRGALAHEQSAGRFGRDGRAGVCAGSHTHQHSRRGIHPRRQVRQALHVREPAEPPWFRREGIRPLLRRRSRRLHAAPLLHHLRRDHALERTAGSSSRKFGWFAWFSGYEWSRDNSKEIEKGWIVKGDTRSRTCRQAGNEAATTSKRRYPGTTENCKKQVDPDFDRPKESLVAIEKPPFYAVKLFPTMVNTQGGPKRNGKCQVLDPFDQPIPRLYTAGELGSFWGWMYNGGGNNAECLCTGQIAARNAVAMKPLA